MLLHIMFRVWVNYLTEAKDAKKQAELEKHLWETLGKHEHVLDKALIHWGSSHSSLLLHIVFRAWNGQPRWSEGREEGTRVSRSLAGGSRQA